MGGGLRASGPARPGTASLAHAHLARLSRLISLWGSPARVEPELNQPDRLVGALRYGRHVAIGVDLQLREEGRRQELVLETDRGTISQVGQTLFHNGQLVLPARGEGLFLQDSRRALEALRAGAIEPENMRLELAALEVADALAAWS
jgi:hypothetical protein